MISDRRNNKKRKSWIVPLTAAVIVAMFGAYWIRSPMPAEIRQRDLEGIIRKNARIKKMVPGSSGRVYLIAQEHYYAPLSITGRDTNAKQAESLSRIQSEIYHLLYDLIRSSGVDFIVGEGLAPGELTLSYDRKGFTREQWLENKECMQDRNFSASFLRANPKETGYTLLEFFHSDAVISWGVDDRRQREDLEELEKQLLAVGLKYVPTKKDYDDPIKRKLAETASEPIRQRKRELNDERSMLYLHQAIARADELKKEDVAIVIGAYHVPLMAKKYSGKRTLYVICPKSAAPIKLD